MAESNTSNNQVNISVIIAVYNMEKYLEANIKSMINQDIESVQFVYVDDGSKDKSSEIISRYASEDNRFLLVHKENGGLSSARNFGMQHAVGEYIVFVDSDDTIEPNTLSKLYETAHTNNLDVLRGRLQHIYPDRIKESQTLGDYTKVMSGRERMLSGEMAYTICEHIYRRKFIEDNRLQFMEGVYHEDMDFIVRAYAYAKRTMETPLVFYNYLVREESISLSSSLKRSVDYYKVACSVKELALSLNDEELYEGYFKEYLAFMYLHAVNICVMQKRRLQELFTYENAYKTILNGIKCGKGIKYKITYMMLKFHLYKFYSLLYSIRSK